MSFFADNKYVLLFYLVIIGLVYLNRKRFDMQGKIVAMYKTQIGVEKMHRWGKKYSEQLRLLGYIGTGVGYIGLFTISFILVKNLFSLLIKPDAQSAVTLVLPGISVPGSPIHIPLVSGWLALFIVILVHEFSHGLVARAHNIKIKSSGIFFLGPIMGAFVEPDEKQLTKAEDIVQYSIYAAGPWSNIILGALVFVLLTFVFSPLIGLMTTESGVVLASVPEGFPAFEAGLTGGMVVTEVNGISVVNPQQFTQELSYMRPNETLNVKANGTEYPVVLSAHPNDARKGYLGVFVSGAAERTLKQDNMFMSVLYAVLMWIAKLVNITGILSLGIGLANLLPLGPVDGGRMLQVSLMRIKGKEAGLKLWKNIAVVTLLILVMNIFWPLFKWIGNLIL